MTEEECNLDLIISDLEQENRLLRARNERLEKRDLTDTEIMDCFDDTMEGGDIVDFGRAIIAKMKS